MNLCVRVRAHLATVIFTETLVAIKSVAFQGEVVLKRHRFNCHEGLRKNDSRHMVRLELAVFYFATRYPSTSRFWSVKRNVFDETQFY